MSGNIWKPDEFVLGMDAIYWVLLFGTIAVAAIPVAVFFFCS